MAWDGLGGFVGHLEERGELVRIGRECDPRLEIAEIADRTMKAGGPALLFERPRGAKFPLLINAYGSARRMAWAVGADASVEERAEELRALIETAPPKTAWEKLKLLPTLGRVASWMPKSGSSGACQDVVLRGNEIDLSILPALTCWPGDGGPFVTLPMVFTRDPENGHRNVGMYRMQVLGPRTTAMHWQVHKTGARHFRRARERGLERLEVAVALGGDPALAFSATAPLPDGIDEMMFAGWLRRRGVRMTKCVDVDLEVPADADFVLEGYVEPQAPLVDEGPFGDHTGYYTPVERFPAFHVTALTHRRDAVYPATIVGPPPMEDAFIGKATERLFLPLLRMTFPEIVDMNLPVEGAFHNLAIVSIKKEYPAHAAKLAHSLWGMGQMMFTKVLVVVDADVDVQDLRDVAWRVLANLDPGRDLIRSEGPTDQLDHAPNVACVSGKLAIDATAKWPEEGYTRGWPKPVVMSEEVRAQVQAIWAELGIPVQTGPATPGRPRLWP